jgi:hypothetical protein
LKVCSGSRQHGQPYDLDPGLCRDERTGSAIVLAILLALAATPAFAKPVIVDVRDKGRATPCAEEDNVYVTLSNPAVRRFQVLARQPVYGAGLKTDIQAPDFSHCALSAAHDYSFTPRTVVLYEDAKVLVKGVTYPKYWRPEQVEVEVAGRRDRGFHLLQLFIKTGGVAQEVMVLHLADGYWRLRPLPLPQFKQGVYGTSFLIGPIEETTRPFVRIAKVVLDPKKRTLHVAFAKGGTADVDLLRVNVREAHLGVSLSPDAASGPMFAAVRSMYVSPDKADTARLVWTRDAYPYETGPVVGFPPFKADAVTFDRIVPSRHNTAAPDMLFDGFRD